MIFYHSALYQEIKDFIHYHKFARSFTQLIPFDVILGTDGKVNSKKFAEFERTVMACKENVPDGGYLMLDSGAFSAKSRGFSIDVQVYIDFIKRHYSWFDEVVALDVIGDAKTTWENYQRMQDAGVDCFPVFHSRETQDDLDRLTGASEYVGFGRVATSAGENAIDVYHARLYDRSSELRYPNTRFHGFGIGAPILFQAYPWHSCDASTASCFARYGSVQFFKLRNGILNFWQMPVSGRMKKLPEHYVHLSDEKRRRVDATFAEYGFSIDDFDEEVLGEEQAGEGLHNRLMFNIYLMDVGIEEITEGRVQLLRPAPSLF